MIVKKENFKSEIIFNSNYKTVSNEKDMNNLFN